MFKALKTALAKLKGAIAQIVGPKPPKTPK